MQKQEYQLALEEYDKSLLEMNDVTVKEARKKCVELKAKAEEQAYLNPELSDKHKEAGNKFFRDGNYAAAMKEYEEAVKRNPGSAALYVNRAMTYMKMVDYPKALEEVERAIKCDPKYVKAYAKKGTIYYLLKEFHRSLSAYEKGLEIDPKNQDCIDGIQKTEETMYKTPPSEERAQKSMADEEIRAIMHDPRVQHMMKEMQENPSGTKPSTTDPFITKAVKKLIAAGNLGMR